MSYRSIFTAMTTYDGIALAHARDFAQKHDGHLDIMSIGLDHMQSSHYQLGSNALIVQTAIEEAQEKANAISTQVTAALQGEKLRWELFSNIWTLSGISQSIAMQARFADIAIVSLPYGETKTTEDTLILEGLLFDANCPTMVIPEGDFQLTPKNIVIGWNESTESLRAVRAALPLLQAAEKVHIAVIDPPQHGPERSDPGGALALFLARHGVHCDIQVMSSGGSKVSARLAQHVTETGAKMLVMGGYGHSRFREAILGGATRDMLEHSKVPVLMAH